MKTGQLLITYEQALSLYKKDIIGKKYLEPHKSWFPLYSSPKLSGIVADLIGDGHLQGNPRWRFDYTFKHMEEKNRFEKELYFLFGIKGNARPCTTNKLSKTFNYGVNCKPLSRVMHYIGVPTGNKVLKKFMLPKWILNNKENFRRFTQRLFTCEGSVWGGNSPGIGIELWKEIHIMDNLELVLNTIGIYLKRYFNITTTNVFTTKDQNIRKDGNKTKPLRIRIKRKDSIMRFYKEIGFEDKVKQEKLKNLIITKWDGRDGNNV